MQAYPAQNDVLSTSVAKDAFIDALEDKELMIRVMEREPQTLDEAYKIAERMELYTKKVNSDDREGEIKQKGNFNRVRATSGRHAEVVARKSKDVSTTDDLVDAEHAASQSVEQRRKLEEDAREIQK